jgi:hypothetical protein
MISSGWLRTAQFHEISAAKTADWCAARRLDARGVPRRSGAPEELGGPTSQPGARQCDTGHPGAKQWRPVREFAGFANAWPGFQGPDFGGRRRGSNGGGVCLVSSRFSGCHPAFKSLILRDRARFS